MDLAKVAFALCKNNMEAYVVADKRAAYEQVKALLAPGCSVAVGGSASLKECGILELLRSGEYNFVDRYAPELTREQIDEVFRKSFLADAYLCSSNAVTEDGVLYNVDGNSNRVAAIAYGPKSVILVVGRNKIVPTLADAVLRMKTVAAPLNAKRLGCKTPCAVTGECISLKSDDPTLCDGCRSPQRICCNYLISAKQRQKGRIKVILVDEDLGY